MVFIITILPPLSAFLMTMFLLLAKAVMACSCGRVMLGKSLGWGTCMVRFICWREVVKDDSWLCFGVGGCQCDFT